MKNTKFADRTKKRLSGKADKVAHQAQLARKIAAECGSQMVAELLELHAANCERNAQLRRQRQDRRRASHHDSAMHDHLRRDEVESLDRNQAFSAYVVGTRNGR